MLYGLTMKNIKNGDGMKRFSTGVMMTMTTGIIMIITEKKRGGGIKRGSEMILNIMESAI